MHRFFFELVYICNYELKNICSSSRRYGKGEAVSLGFEMDNIRVSNICTKASITIGFHRRKLYPCLQGKEEGKYKESIQSSTIPPRH